MAAASPLSYDVYGLTLESDVSLTLPRARDGETGGIISITTARAKEFEARLAGLSLEADRPVHQILLRDGSLYMRWTGLFDLLVSRDGHRISFRNSSDRAFDYIEAYLMNYAVSAALLQQGEETLHATAVDIGGGVVGLLGSSGAGKSTLASFLRTKGGRIVTDDVLRIDLRVGVALVHPGPHRLKLFDEAARLFLPGAPPSGRWSPMRDKLVYDLGVPEAPRGPQRLAALYHLRAPKGRDHRGIDMARLGGAELFRTLGGSTMNNAVSAPGRAERHFRFVERVARMIPVYALSYPRNFDCLKDVAQMILRSAVA